MHFVCIFFSLSCALRILFHSLLVCVVSIYLLLFSLVVAHVIHVLEFLLFYELAKLAPWGLASS